LSKCQHTFSRTASYGAQGGGIFSGVQERQSGRYAHLNASHEVLGAAQLTMVSASADALVLLKVAIPAHDEGHQGMPADARVRS